MNVIIYRAGAVLHTINVTDNSYVNRSLMGDETAFIEFYSLVPLDLQMGDYCTLRNHTYFIKDAVVPVRDVSRLKYQLTVYGTQYELEKSLFFILDSTGVNSVLDTTWNCTPAEFLAQLVVNMKRLQPSVDWGVGECLSANAKDITLSNNDCFEMLKSAAELWECDYYVDEYLVSLKKIVPGPYPLSLEVGFNKGLKEITANKSGDSNIISRLFAYGSTQNMPVGQRLSIPAVDAPDAILVTEGMKIFEDIYPRIECIIESIVHMGADFMRTAPLGFVINDYRIYGSLPMITFLSGELQGYEFIMGWQYDYLFTLEPLEITGGIFIPGPTGYNYHVGDEFVIWNINMPPVYVADAQSRLQAAAVAYLEQVSRQKLKLNLTIDDIYFARNPLKVLYPGQTLNIKSSIIPFLVDGVDVNVIGLKNYITQPHKYESVTVGDVYYSRPFGTVVQVTRNETIFKSSEAGVDKYYRHYQSIAAAEWTVNHDLDKRPSVTVTDEAGKQVDAVVTYTAPNTLKINFSVARTGYAECN